MIERHLQNQLQRCSAKQDRESVITPEHSTIERYFEKKIVYTSVYRKKMARKRKLTERINHVYHVHWHLLILANTCLLDYFKFSFMFLEPVSYEKLLAFLTDSFFKTSYHSLSIAVCKSRFK